MTISEKWQTTKYKLLGRVITWNSSKTQVFVFLNILLNLIGVTLYSTNYRIFAIDTEF